MKGSNGSKHCTAAAGTESAVLWLAGGAKRLSRSVTAANTSKVVGTKMVPGQHGAPDVEDAPLIVPASVSESKVLASVVPEKR